MPLVEVPGIPEIRVHKAVPQSGLHRLAAADPRFGAAPYWAHFWAGGLALARYLLDSPEQVRGRMVLDLGTGSGLVAIAAAKAGARHVLAADTDPVALQAAMLNAAANGVSIELLQEDLLDGDPRPVETVLVGDLFYEPELAVRVEAFLDRCRDRGAHVLVGDPMRPPLPRHRLRQVASYTVSETEATARISAVFELG